MRVICDRATLLDAINTVSGAVAQRSPREALTRIRLTARNAGDGGTLTLAGTDAEISIRLDIGVDVKTPGDVLVPADRIRSIVQAEEHDPTLTIDAAGDQCTIRGQDAVFRLPCTGPEDFPAIPDFQAAVSGSGPLPKARTVFTMPAGQFTALVGRTSFAAAKESTRYSTNGVLIKRDGKKLELAATDGRRLAVSRTTLSGPAEKDAKTTSCIVPPRALAQLQKLMRDADEPANVAITDTQFMISFGPEKSPPRAVLTSNLVEGNFPPYDEVIPRENDKRVTCDRDVMASAVKRAALLTTEESRGVRMKFTGKERQLELSSRADQVGEAQVNVELKGYEGEDLEIGFNPLFILDALRVITDPDVIFEFKNSSRPGLLRSGNDFLYVVMPVALTS